MPGPGSARPGTPTTRRPGRPLPQLHVTWATAGAIAAVLIGVGALVSVQLRRRRLGAAIREVGIVLGLFGLWMFVGHLVGHHPAGGYRRGAAIWHAERDLHIADEATLQRPLLDHRWLLDAVNYYYAYAHWLSVDVVLAWLWLRHRDRYVVTRAVLVVFTGCCLCLHLISTAPPRLLAQTQLVDTAAALGQSVYGDTPGLSDHLSAMPSIHVGWAVLFAVAAWGTRSTLARVLLTVHALVMSYVVVVTGNQFWLDGVAAAAMVAVAWPVVAGAMLHRSRSRGSGVTLLPAQPAMPVTDCVP
jgi:hypothetical protein